MPPPPRPEAPQVPMAPYEIDSAAMEPFVEAPLIKVLHTPEIDDVLAEAEGRFRGGEAYFQEGRFELARRLFDESIELLLEAPADAYDRSRLKAKCDELIEAIHRYDVAALSASGRAPGYETAPLDELMAVTFPMDPNADLTLADELKLPASELPLEVNGHVMRYVRFFSSPRGRRTLEDGLRRLGRYRPMIQRILDEEGVPRELLYLPMPESGYKARAMSRKRAAGIWQFMRLRGAEYGLAQTKDYDERLDPEKATRAAARHLRDLYERLGDWYLALAAYNGGPARITRAVRRTGHADFWEFCNRRALPRETRNYVPIILATIVMAKNPAQYGLEDLDVDPPLEYNSIEMTERTHLGLLADILRTPIEEMRELNPALLRDVAPAGFLVHVPRGKAGFVRAALKNVPREKRADWRVHHVGRGETLAEIAQIYATTTEEINLANGGSISAPEAGDLVVIPTAFDPARGGSLRNGRATPRPESAGRSRSGG